MLEDVSVLLSFLWPHTIPLYGYTILFIHLPIGTHPPLAMCFALSRNLSLLTRISHAWFCGMVPHPSSEKPRGIWWWMVWKVQWILGQLPIYELLIPVHALSLMEGNSTAMGGREFSGRGWLKQNQTLSTELGECCRQEIGGWKIGQKGKANKTGNEFENNNVNWRLETMWLSFSLLFQSRK